MDPLKIRLFIKNLTYDLDTVQCLLDYDRVIETFPIIEKILQHIDAFRANNAANGLKNIFDEKFWDNKLSDKSFPEIRGNLALYAQQNPDGYSSFVKNILKWSENSLPALQHEAKSPLRKEIEKISFWLIGILTVLLVLFCLIWSYFTKDWGLRGDFCNGIFQDHLFTGYKKEINFYAPEEMGSRLPHDNFSTHWTGTLIIPKDGLYTITEMSDDGARVFIDGKIFIDDWTSHGPGLPRSGKGFFHQGPHSLTLDYYQLSLGATLTLSWAFEDGELNIIPARYLRHPSVLEHI